jgi:hypothetical protein
VGAWRVRQDLSVRSIAITLDFERSLKSGRWRE